MFNFDKVLKTDSAPLKQLKKPAKSPLKKALIKYGFISGLLYIGVSVIYFTIFLISLAV